MKKNIFKALSVMIFCCLIMAVYTVASSAMVQIVEENLINGTDIAEKKDYNVVNGITESYIVTMNDDGTNRVNNYVLEIDMNNPEIGIVASYKNYMNDLGKAEWGMQHLRDQAVAVENYYVNTVGNEDFEVVAGVNGDFFNMGNGAPTGTLVMNGIRYNTNNDWPFFALLDDGSVVIGDRGDKPPANAMQVVGGPEVLLVDGKFSAAVKNSGYGVDRHPRTAIGVKENGNIVMLVSDGRMLPESSGQDFNMLAEIMLALGCEDALCLDGGGSASFISQRDGEDILTLRNTPSDGIERTVSTGLLVYTNKDTNKYSNTSKWFTKDGKVGYYGADGTPVKGEQTIDGYNYTFDANGWLTSYAEVYVDGTIVTNSWVGTKYYLGADGLPVKGEHKIGNTTFTFNSTTGVLEKSNLTSKWCECGTSICYFDANGNKVTGETKIGTTTYPFDADGKLTVFACVKDDGTLVKNQWVGKSYYVGDNGLPVSGKYKLDGHTYTFGTDGKFIKGELKDEGFYSYYYIGGEKQRNWHMIDGYWYYFDRMTGFGMASLELDGRNSVDTVKDGKYPISTTDARLEFKFDKNGRLIGGAWLETDYGKAYYWGNHQRLLGWQTIDGSKYYFDNNTYAVTGKKIIDGVMYGFSKDGKLEHTYTLKTDVAVTCVQDGYKVYICNDCGDEYKETFKAQGHNYTETVIPSTCAQVGTNTRICKVCGDKQIEYLEVVPHDFTETITAPTCTKPGLKTSVCNVCGYEEKEEIVATGHSYTEEVIAPTCTTQGYTVFTCSVCGDITNGNYVDVTEHTFTATVIPPTCTQQGEIINTCSACGYTIKETADATGHDYEVVEVKADCTTDGATISTCKVCNDVKKENIVPATGHDFSEEVIPPTNETQGYTIFTCKTCAYTYNGNYVGALNHNYVAVVTPPTCTQDGYTTYSCDCGCGDSYVGDIVKASHSFESSLIIAPTCTEKGYTVYVCSVCNETKNDDYTDATGHDYASVVVAPTCTVQGYTTHTCSVCSDEKTDSYVAATGHSYTAEITEPTCTQPGQKTETCACGDVKVTNINAKGHDYEVVKVEADCTTNGATISTCKVCNDVKKENIVPATGHKYDSVATDPTCTENGYITHTCSVCGNVNKEDIPALGHTESDWIVVKPAEVGVEGKEQKKCSVCSVVLDERVIPALKETEPDALLGDVNGDGKITAADARLALRISAKLETPTEIQFAVADYNKDGKITAADARSILRKSAKLEP